MKEKLLTFISYFHWYDLLLFSAFALLGMCFIFLSFIAFRKKFISIPLFLLGFAIMIAIPFAMRYFMEERFYKISIEKSYDSVYNYSDVYQYIGEITNVGKRNIAGCVFSHQILYDTSKETGIIKYKHLILNYIKPKQVYNKDIPMDLKVGQSVKISEVMEDYSHRGEPYITKIECYGKSKAQEGQKILQGVYKPKQEQTKDATLESKTQEQTSNVANTQNTNITENPSDATQPTTTTIPSTQITTQASNTTPKEEIITNNTKQEDNVSKDSSSQNPSNQEQNLPKQEPIPETPPIQTPTIPQIPKIPQTPMPQIPAPQIPMPQAPNLESPQDNTRPPNWRELRDNFSVPLLKETPR